MKHELGKGPERQQKARWNPFAPGCVVIYILAAIAPVVALLKR